MGEDSDRQSGELDEQAGRARTEVIEAMTHSAEVYGAKPSYGRLYGILYFADDPLSLDELVDRSGYAKSTVSTTMSTLERFKMVQRRSIPDEGKRVFFEAEDDLWAACQQILDQLVRREVDTMSQALASATESLEDSDADVERDLQRVRRLQETYDQWETLLEFLADHSAEELVAMVEMLEETD